MSYWILERVLEVCS